MDDKYITADEIDSVRETIDNMTYMLRKLMEKYPNVRVSTFFIMTFATEKEPDTEGNTIRMLTHEIMSRGFFHQRAVSSTLNYLTRIIENDAGDVGYKNGAATSGRNSTTIVSVDDLKDFLLHMSGKSSARQNNEGPRPSDNSN